LVGLQVLFPLLLLRAFALEGQVPDFLRPHIEFAQLFQGIALALNHSGGLLGDLAVFAHEALGFLVPLPAGLLPKLVSVGDFSAALPRCAPRTPTSSGRPPRPPWRPAAW